MGRACRTPIPTISTRTAGSTSRPSTAAAGCSTRAGSSSVSFLPEQCFYPVNFLIDEAPPFDGAKLRERSLAYFERAIDLTAALGIAAHAGDHARSGAGRGTAQRFEHTAGKALPRVIESFGRLTRRAEQRGRHAGAGAPDLPRDDGGRDAGRSRGGARRRRLEGAGGDARYRPHQRHRAGPGPRPDRVSPGAIDRLGPRLQHLHHRRQSWAISTRICCRARAISTSSPPTRALKRAGLCRLAVGRADDVRRQPGAAQAARAAAPDPRAHAAGLGRLATNQRRVTTPPGDPGRRRQREVKT